MTNERNALKAGSFIVISIVLIVGIVVGIKGVKRFLEPVQKHEVRFRLGDDIGGLAAGDSVRIGGANVGTVRDVELETESDNPGIVITFSIPERFHVHDDAVLKIQTTITGVSVLNFESLGTGAALASGEMLKGKSAPSFPELVATAKDFIADAHAVTLPKINSSIDVYKQTGASATDLIAAIRSKIDPIVERYNKFADKGAFALNEIGTLFSDTKSDFRTTIANVKDATGSIKERLPDLLQKLDGTLTKVSRALDQINDALTDIKQAAGSARDATGSARSILLTNRSKIDKMIDSIKTAGDNLKFATSEIRRSPWRLLYKPAPGEMANLNLYDSARQFADGANNMSDAAQALRDALKDPKTDDKKIQELVDQLDKSFQNFTQVESTLWKEVK